MGSGIPGLQSADHLGITVPDLDAAQAFLVDVIGAEYIYTLGAKKSDDGWMAEHLGVHPRTVIREIRFLRLGAGLNLELFDYASAEAQADHPRNSDLGGYHLALYVDDIDAAIEHLHRHGVETMGAPTASTQAAEGQRWVYFLSPWGMQFELVSYPGGKAYERDSPAHLWHPTRLTE